MLFNSSVSELSVKKVFVTILALLVLVGCQTPPKSSYKEISSVSDLDQSRNEINVCRDGAFADRSVLMLYFDSDFVATIPQSLYSKTHYKVLYDESVKVISVRQIDGKPVTSLTVTQKTPRKVYLAIVSETTSFVPIPLPGFVYTKTKGNRRIQAVSSTAFQDLCGNVDATILTK